MSKYPGIFNLHATAQKGPHIFDQDELPKTLFLSIYESVRNHDGIPECHVHIKQFIDMEILKGQPFENDVRALVGLGPRRST